MCKTLRTPYFHMFALHTQSISLTLSKLTFLCINTPALHFDTQSSAVIRKAPPIFEGGRLAHSGHEVLEVDG